MPRMTNEERARKAGQAAWSGLTPDERRERGQALARASAVARIIREVDQLSQDQRDRLIAALTEE